MPTAGVGAGPGGCDAHESTAISWRLDAQQAKRIRHELGLNPISWCETPSPGLENQLAHVCSLSLCCFLRARTRMHHSIACQQDSAGGVNFCRRWRCGDTYRASPNPHTGMRCWCACNGLGRARRGPPRCQVEGPTISEEGPTAPSQR